MEEADALRSSRRFRLAAASIGVVLLAVAAIGVYLSRGGDSVSVSPPTITRNTGAPQPVPELRFQDARGNPRALADFRGRTVLLNVWATWCAPCREEMPALDRLQQKLGGPEFEVVALSIDSGGARDVRRFFEELGIRSLAIYVDPSMQATEKLRIVGVPTTLFIDRQGRERWRKSGPAQWDSPEVVQRLRAEVDGERADGK